MRIALVTQNDPFYLPLALQRFCEARRDVCAMIVLPAFNESRWATARRLYEFYGPLDFARLCARYVRAWSADRLNRLGPMTRPYSAADVARRAGVPFYRPPRINAPPFVARVREEIRPDLLVSVAASQIFRSELLSVPRLGCINLHSAPLPRYQGMMPNFWTLLHGEPEATVTVHYMDEKLDAGDILVQRSFPVGPGDSLHEVMIRSKRIGVEALLEAVEQIERGTARPRPMDPRQATYFSFPRRKHALRLRRMGRALLRGARVDEESLPRSARGAVLSSRARQRPSEGGMPGYIELYRQVRAEFARSPKSTAPWDTGNGLAGRLVFRPLGLLLAPLFIKLSLSGNVVTLLSFVMGMLGNALFLLGDPGLFLAGALCLFGFAALDFTDGLVARHQGKSTHYGKMMDLLSGVFVASFEPVFVGFGAARAGEAPAWLGTGALYLFLAAMATTLNLMSKLLAASFDLERAKVQRLGPSALEPPGTGGRGLRYRARRVLFHLTANTAQIVLLALTLAGFAFVFPLALFALASVQLAAVVLEVFRTGPKVLAVEKP